jgi:hypothetical protein
VGLPLVGATAADNPRNQAYIDQARTTAMIVKRARNVSCGRSTKIDGRREWNGANMKAPTIRNIIFNGEV